MGDSTLLWPYEAKFDAKWGYGVKSPLGQQNFRVRVFRVTHLVMKTLSGACCLARCCLTVCVAKLGAARVAFEREGNQLVNQRRVGNA